MYLKQNYGYILKNKFPSVKAILLKCRHEIFVYIYIHTFLYDGSQIGFIIYKQSIPILKLSIWSKYLHQN